MIGSEDYEADGYNEHEDYPDIYELEDRISDLESNPNRGNHIAYDSCLSIGLYTPGLVLAMILSYDANHSIFLALWHGFLSWGYVIYRILF